MPNLNVYNINRYYESKASKFTEWNSIYYASIASILLIYYIITTMKNLAETLIQVGLNESTFSFL